MQRFLSVTSFLVLVTTVTGAPVPTTDNERYDLYEDYFYSMCPVYDCPIFYDDALPCAHDDLQPTYDYIGETKCLGCPVCPDPVTSTEDDVTVTSLVVTEMGTDPEEATTSAKQEPSSSETTADATSDSSGSEPIPTTKDDVTTVTGTVADPPDNNGAQSAPRINTGITSVSRRLQSTLSSIQHWLFESAKKIADMESRLKAAE